MRRWLGQQMARPWVARIICGALFVAIMAGVRMGAHAVLDGGGTERALIVAAIFFPCLFAFALWMDRRGY